MPPELLSGLAGVVLSLAMTYVPGLSAAYGRLSSDGKRGVMALALVVAGFLAAILSCESPGSLEASQLCAGGFPWKAISQSILTALVANQGVHRLTPERTRSDDQAPVLGA